MNVSAVEQTLESAVPDIRLPDLREAVPPERCPLCGAPPLDDPATDEQVVLHDLRGTAIYSCYTGYAPGRTDYVTEPGLLDLPVHDALHPRQFLLLFCAYYQDRLGSFNVAHLPGMDRRSLSQLGEYGADGHAMAVQPPFLWSMHPFSLSLPGMVGPPPETCPACGAEQVRAERGHADSLYADVCRYACGMGYTRDSRRGSFHWGGGWCTHPRPFLLLNLPKYWRAEGDAYTREAHGAVVRAWLDEVRSF